MMHNMTPAHTMSSPIVRVVMTSKLLNVAMVSSTGAYRLGSTVGF